MTPLKLMSRASQQFEARSVRRAVLVVPVLQQRGKAKIDSQRTCTDCPSSDSSLAGLALSSTLASRIRRNPCLEIKYWAMVFLPALGVPIKAMNIFWLKRLVKVVRELDLVE